MPTYDFDCTDCGPYDYFCSISDYDRNTPCPDCGKVGKRVFVRNGMFTGEKVEDAEYNPGLGCVTKNSKHRAQIAAERGLVEIGNEKPADVKRDAERVRRERRDRPYLTGKELWQIKDSMR